MSKELPDVESPPSPASMASAKNLIASSLDQAQSATPHPRLPALRETKLSEVMSTSLASLTSSASKSPKIDLSRYEPPSAPDATDPSSSSKEAWSAALRAAYISKGYLSARATNLGLLETYGRNAWLVSNAALEDDLRRLEGEVKALDAAVQEEEEVARRQMEERTAELDGLEEQWRVGVGRSLEVSVAAERVKAEIEARMRRVAAEAAG